MPDRAPIRPARDSLDPPVRRPARAADDPADRSPRARHRADDAAADLRAQSTGKVNRSANERQEANCGRASTALVFAGLFMLLAPHCRRQRHRNSPSQDGLQLARTCRTARLHEARATFGQPKRLALLDCFVQFANWRRDYNQNEPDLDADLAGRHRPYQEGTRPEFRRVFTAELQTNGGYEIVDIAAPNVLILRPAILNLIVNAPEIDTAPADVRLRGRVRRADDALPRAVGFHDEHAARPRDRHGGGPGARRARAGRRLGGEQGSRRPHPEELGGPYAQGARNRPRRSARSRCADARSNTLLPRPRPAASSPQPLP